MNPILAYVMNIKRNVIAPRSDYLFQVIYLFVSMYVSKVNQMTFTFRFHIVNCRSFYAFSRKTRKSIGEAHALMISEIRNYTEK